MFIGSVPKDVIQQILKVVEIKAIPEVYIACSGAFRLERAIKQVNPNARVHANDVSIFSSCLAGLATGQAEPITCTGQLEFLEGKYEVEDAWGRTAAMLVAFEMTKYAKKKTRYDTAFFDSYVRDFDALHDKAMVKLTEFVEQLTIDSYFKGDWLEQVQRAYDAKACVMSFPPTYKAGYEKMFGFINDNVTWSGANYELFDPTTLPAIAMQMHEQDIPYCLFADQDIEGLHPSIRYEHNLKRPVRCFTRAQSSSYRQIMSEYGPFKYKCIDPDAIGPKTKVTIVKSDNKRLGYLKDVYLAKGIVHSSGQFCFEVYLDDMLAGGFILDDSQTTRTSYGPDAIFVLSDFSLTRHRKIAKLIATLALCKSNLEAAEVQMMKKYRRAFTAVFSMSPASMKYRGTGMKRVAKKQPDGEGTKYTLTYGAWLNTKTPQEIYNTWFQKHGRTAK